MILYVNVVVVRRELKGSVQEQPDKSIFLNCSEEQFQKCFLYLNM